MATNFLPSREADLVTWSVNFKTKITATPTAYGLTAAQASAYGTLHNAFVAAYQMANNPNTRSPSNIIAKDTAKNALETSARMLARMVQATPSVTAQQKSDLGLTVRVGPTPIPPPSDSPNIDVVGRMGTTVSTRLHDGSGSRRGKPAGVAGASVFSFVGTQPPMNVNDWKFEGNNTRTTVDVTFDAALAPGTVVWLTAFWYNPRGQSGPGCTPISAILAGGGMQQAA
jgi:hypothetical protein